MSADSGDPLLTLEPLLEAVRAGVEAAGWELSGLQKTTSHQFEGRWEGDSSRSAYLFFHLPHGSDHASVDVFLDETSRGLVGNVALVLDGAALGELGDAEAALGALCVLSRRALPSGHRTPLTLRFRADAATGDSATETEIRFKLRIPKRSIEAGSAAVARLAHETVQAFEALMADPELRPYAPLD